MKVEPVDRTESVVGIAHRENNKLMDEVEPQKSERELRDKQIGPRQSTQKGMDVTA